MTKEEAWLMWMKESKNYVDYDWDIIKKSSWWEAFSRGWDAATVNTNGWDNAYKMGLEAGKEIKKEWVGLTDEEIDTWNIVGHESLREFVRAIETKLKEKNGA